MKLQQSQSTLMPNTDREVTLGALRNGGRSGLWRFGGVIGADCQLWSIYGLGEQGTEKIGNFTIAHRRPNPVADSTKPSGRYRLRIAVPV